MAKEEILVVDDDLELCHVIVDTLSDQGYRATYVETTEEALKRITTRCPDLILLDLEVPSMGGFVLCQKIHENPATREVPVVFLSVRDSDFDRKTAMSLGADLYITKPFRRSVLLKEVENLLAQRAAAKDLIGQPRPSTPSPLLDPSPLRGEGGNGNPLVTSVDLTAKKGASYYAGEIRRRLEPRLKAAWAWSLVHKAWALAIAFALVGALATASVRLFRVIAASGGGLIKAADDDVQRVNVIQAAYAPFQDVLSNVGTVKGGSEIELRFQTDGQITAINFHDGDTVRAGQVIAQLDQKDAKLKEKRAEQEYFRYEKLYALGGVSKDKLDEAKAQWDYAVNNVRKTVIVATQDGIFGGKDASAGESVGPTKRIGTLVSINTVMVSIGVIEKEIDKVFPGQKVTATVETYPNVEFKGKVETISPLIEGGAKTVNVEARIPNEGKLLLPGMFARTRIVVYEQDSVIAVSNDAVEKTESGHQVYVVDKESKAQIRPVKVSYVSLVNSVISEGLEPGEQVIIQRPQELKAGAPVKVADVEKPISDGAARDAMNPAENPPQ